MVKGMGRAGAGRAGAVVVERAGVGRKALVAQLAKSPHGNLDEYLVVGVPGAQEDPEFFGHLVAWNAVRGQVRDAKVALPLLALMGRPGALAADLRENAHAHLALLDPRNLLRGLVWARPKDQIHGEWRGLRSLVEIYLRAREQEEGWWDRTVLTHRASMKDLYKLARVKPSRRAQAVLFEREAPEGSVFAAIRSLHAGSTDHALETLAKWKLPWLVVRGALGKKLEDPGVLAQVIGRMSGLELTTNLAALEKLGVRQHPETRAALDAALTSASTSKRGTLKTGKAQAAVKDKTLQARAAGLAERQATDALQVVDGDWVVLVDRSGSQAQSIVVGREVAAVLAKAVKGSVWVVFFNNDAQGLEVTGKTLAEIQALTRNVEGMGGTQIGRALDWVREKGLPVDGIAVVTDGGEGGYGQTFAHAYQRAAAEWEKEVPVYVYLMPGDPNYMADNCREAGVELQTFDLTSGKVDWASLPNLVHTMRANPYGLADEIMETPLVTLMEALKRERVGRA